VVKLWNIQATKIDYNGKGSNGQSLVSRKESMKKNVLQFSVLLTLLFASGQGVVNAQGQPMLMGKGRFFNALRQVNLSPQQVTQINQITQQWPRGKGRAHGRNQQIKALLSHAQKKQLHMIMKGVPY
jgi:hypothetical protein